MNTPNRELTNELHSERLEELERLADQFDDLPREVLLKEDLLRLGIAFDEEALRFCSEFKTKSYFIFSFDMVPISEMQGEENLRAPEEIRFFGGENQYQPTTVSVRVNPYSAYRAFVRDGSLFLGCGTEDLAEIELLPVPEYYQQSLANGQPVHEVAPTIEWGYLIYLTVYRKCQYFGFQEECRFCDINENYRQQVKAGRPYRTVKPIEEVIEALDIISSVTSSTHAYTLTGGSITRSLKGHSEADFYAGYASAIETAYPGRWISKVVAQALQVT